MRRPMVGALAGTLLWLTACASTEVGTTWRNPSFDERMPSKVLVAAIVPDDVRVEMEQQLATSLAKEGVQAVTLSSILPPGQPVTAPSIRQALSEGSFNGLLLSRYKRTNKQVTGWSGGWAGYYFAPGYWDVQPQAQVQTSLFDPVGEGHLLWTGSSKTAPSRTSVTSQDIAGYADVMVKRLLEDMTS
jgi:hypothetical protein